MVSHGKGGRSFLYLLVYALAACAALLALGGPLWQLHRHSTEAAAHLAQTERRHDELQGRVTQLEARQPDAGKVQAALESALAALEDLKVRVAASQTEMTARADRLEESLRASGAAAAEAARSSQKLNDLERAILEVRAAQKSAEEAWKTAQEHHEKLWRELRQSLSAATPPQPAPQPSTAPLAAAKPRIECKVELIEGQLLVLAAGSRAGVEVGRVFEVRRGEQRIARVQVTRVQPDRSGARVLAAPAGSGEIPAGEIKAGDVAVAD